MCQSNLDDNDCGCSNERLRLTLQVCNQGSQLCCDLQPSVGCQEYSENKNKRSRRQCEVLLL